MKLLDRELNVVVIAGASGIGKSIVEHYIQEGSRVFVCDVSDDLIKSFKEDLPETYIEQTDVSAFQEVQAFFTNIASQVDCIDVLINSAGIAGPTALLEDADPSHWGKTMDVNVTGMFHACREALPLLKKSKGGSIINLASNAAYYGFPFRSAYAASKWAVLGLTKTLAMEVGKYNIRVNAICPGSVSGDRIDRVIKADAEEKGVSIEEVKELYVKQVSLKTFVEPEDVAN
ncbi:MAG: SDR family oxidoreductase, partial [Ekhidna sp.]|nr:SDR family oxidoreductase [Ekhidna sp.]